jgi:hypothetical protein
MNRIEKEQDMKIHRALFSPVVPSLLAMIAAGAVWWGGTPAHALGTWNTALVSIQGTVTGSPESVVFSGQAKIDSKLAPDPDFNRPSLVISVDLTGVSGVGSSSAAKYVITGPEIVQRGVAASQLVEITFPFVKSTMGMSATRSGVAAFALSFDVNTGAVTSATGNVASPNF